MNVVGAWNRWHGLLDAPHPYADTVTYQMAVEWTEPCSLVEDWGCGGGWLRTLIPPERYRGIDGSHSPYADEVVDLSRYRSNVPGIVMRHVLEHNRGWQRILSNALGSFAQRMALVLFTPFANRLTEIDHEVDPKVSTYSLPRLVFHELLDQSGAVYSHQTLDTRSKYDAETIFLLEKP